MPCSHTQNCELYVRFAADPSIEVWKKHFCNNDFKKCARFDLSLKGMSVPLDLLPNGKKIAANTDSVDVGLNTLFNAIKKNRLPMVEAIIRVKSINEEMSNSAGVTPTMFAAALGRKEMVDFFLRKGCNPHNQCQKGKTALDYAVENNQTGCAETIKSAMTKTSAQKVIKPEEELIGADETSPSLFRRLFGFLRGSSQKAA